MNLTKIRHYRVTYKEIYTISWLVWPQKRLLIFEFPRFNHKLRVLYSIIGRSFIIWAFWFPSVDMQGNKLLVKYQGMNGILILRQSQRCWWYDFTINPMHAFLWLDSTLRLVTIYLGRFHQLVLMEIEYCEHAPDCCMSALLVGLFIYETVVQDYVFNLYPIWQCKYRETISSAVCGLRLYKVLKNKWFYRINWVITRFTIFYRINVFFIESRLMA